MKRILIIEDDAHLVEAYKEKLISAGYDCDIAFTGKESLSKLKTYPPDLVILDIMLPGEMNGFDVLEEMKREVPLSKIPVIVLTNLDSEKKTAAEIGASEYLVKANTPIATVLEIINKYLK